MPSSLGLLHLVTAAAAAGAAQRAARAFACLVHVVEVRRGNGIRIERHDRIGERLALVRLDPRLDVAAAGQRECQYTANRQPPTVDRFHVLHSLSRARIWFRYSPSSPGL